MKYEHYAGFISHLTDKFADVDSDLPIHEQHLAQLKNRITDGKYTFLKILDGTHTEYIKVSNRGGALFVERGYELTAPENIPYWLVRKVGSYPYGGTRHHLPNGVLLSERLKNP